MTERPYVIHCRGPRGRNAFRLEWAVEYNARYTVDRNIGRYFTAEGVERACLQAYGVVPEFYGIGF